MLDIIVFTQNKIKFNNVNARFLAHALLQGCSFSSACARLSGRGRKFFLAHALHMEKIHIFELLKKSFVFFCSPCST